MAFLPDGRQLISAGGDHVARLWWLATGREIRRFTGNRDFIDKISLSADGRRLATASWDHTARVFDVATGQQLALFQRGREVSAVALEPQGRAVLVGDFGGTAQVYNLATLAQVQGFGGDCGYAAAWSPDSTLTAKGGERPISVWDMRRMREVGSFGNETHVYSLDFSPDGWELLCTAGNAVRLIETESLEEVRRFVGHTDRIHAAAFSPDGRRVLSGGQDNTVRLWDAQTGRQIHEFTGHTGTVRGVAFSPDGRLGASASEDGTIRIWRLPDADARTQVPAPQGRGAEGGDQ